MTIVVINRCTDATEEIARRRGARIVRDDSRNLARIRTSCRKFDRLGDWFLLRHPVQVVRVLRGRDQALGDRFFYDFEHKKKESREKGE
jgi:hypothetical protein